MVRHFLVPVFLSLLLVIGLFFALIDPAIPSSYFAAAVNLFGTGNPPTVATMTIVNAIAQTAATVNGDITSTGGTPVTARGFAYGADPTLSVVISTTTESDQFFAAGPFTGAASDLSCGTSYYFRAYATNSAGDGLGSIQTFATAACRREGVRVPPKSSSIYPSAVSTQEEASAAPAPSATSVPSVAPSAAETAPATSAAPVVSTNVPFAGIFTRNLTVGMTGSDVKTLQIFLNAHGFIIAKSGIGSSGNESTYFGILTRDALAKFQEAKGIAPSSGYFGPLTREAVLKILTSTN